MASATDFDDHHRGRRRQAADKSDQREQFGMRAQRQRQNEHVAVGEAERECQQSRHGDRHHEQIDEHEISGKQKCGAADLGFAPVLHHADVKLPGQKDDREQR